MFQNKGVGRTKSHEHVNECAVLYSHTTRTAKAIRTLCGGVAHYLCVNNKGSVKSTDPHNVKRQKYPVDGKVVLRKNKGKNTKYSVPTICDIEDIRYNI